MSTVVKDLGAATAYGYAVEKGYTGTEEEFAELMASYATVGQTAVTAAQTATTKASEAATSAIIATNKASEATTAAQTASTKASEAVGCVETATQKATEASQSASQASGYAQTAETAKTDAQTAKTQAETARDNAVTAKTAAETAQGKAEDAQAAAESVAESIPSDYSQLSEDVSDLKSEITALESDGVVPSAEQILTDKGVTDCVPYHYRKTSGDGADRLYDQIVGGSVAWNQLVRNGDFSNGSDRWSLYMATAAFDNNIATVVTDDTVNVNSGGSLIQTGITVFANHKYIVSATIKGDGEHRTALRADGGFSFNAIVNVSNDFKTFDGIAVGVSDTSSGRVVITAYGPSITILVKNVKLFDLTAMFGTTIADYVYGLETAHTGDGVAFFNSLFPNDYYPYNAGELKSVEGVSAHETVGFNQFDKNTVLNGYIINDTTGDMMPVSAGKATDYISVIPNQTYYIKSDQATGGWGAWYDADKNYISSITGYIKDGGNVNKLQTAPTDARYMRLTCFYNNSGDLDTFCINLSDPAKNGTYEPYKGHSYPLDSTVELRGILKLDSNNKLYFDGDVYEYTGKVTRNTILRAYQSGDESLANAITDGTNTVVYSANASTEQAQPYQHLQQCDPNGTEEYVSTGIVPIGHNSFYPENLRAKVEQLPWNFASIIAPTESAFVATRNYTTGSLFIVDNVLYKATSNIANGGTITPNTNCTATTLAEIISALA